MNLYIKKWKIKIFQINIYAHHINDNERIFIMPDGQTYEKDTFKKAFEITHVSPITKVSMKFSEGKINYSIKSLIEKYVKENNFDLNIIDEKIKN